MRLILVDRGKEFCDVVRWQFRSHPEVQVVCGRFEDLPSFDCVVTAGNSFGLMDAQFMNPSVAQQRHEKIHYGGRWGFMNPRKPDA